MIPAVIVDVDSTLCDPGGYPMPRGMWFAQSHHRIGRAVLIVTAREERWRTHTQRWLTTHLPVPIEGLWMRQNGDWRPDDQVKADIFAELSRRYIIHAAIDDRPDVLDLWRRLRIPDVVAAA